MLNQTSVYKTFEIQEKNAHLMEEKTDEDLGGIQTDQVKEKLSQVQQKIGVFTAKIEEFAIACDEQLDGLVEKL